MKDKLRLSSPLFKIILHDVIGHSWQKDFWIAEDGGNVNAYKCDCGAYVIPIGDHEVPGAFELPSSCIISGETIPLSQFIPSHPNGKPWKPYNIWEYRSKTHKLSVKIGILLLLIKKEIFRACKVA